MMRTAFEWKNNCGKIRPDRKADFRKIADTGRSNPACFFVLDKSRGRAMRPSEITALQIPHQQIFVKFFCFRGCTTCTPSKPLIFLAFQFQIRLERGRECLERDKKRPDYRYRGARRALPKRRVCRYHNPCEVATHEIRNTAARDGGCGRQRGKDFAQEKEIISPPHAAGSPAGCPVGLRSSLPFRDGKGGRLYVYKQ